MMMGNHQLALDLGAVAQGAAAPQPVLPLTPNEARITQEIFEMFGTNATQSQHEQPVVFPSNASTESNANNLTSFVTPTSRADIDINPFSVASAPPVPITTPIVHAPVAPISAPLPDTRPVLPPQPQIPAPAPATISQTTPVAKEGRNGNKDASWGVALAKLNAHRSALESWAQEVKEKRPAFGTTRDREERRKETNRKSAKVSRLRWRAYLVELEKVLVDGERRTETLKKEVVDIDNEQRELEATLIRLREQVQLRRQGVF